MTLVELRRVHKAYRQGGRTVAAVNGIDLVIPQGEFVSIVGRSGSGKTTLLNLIGGLVKPTSGQVLLEGIDLWTLNDAQLSAVRHRRVGVVFQFASLLPTLAVLDNVRLPLFLGQGSGDGIQRARDLLRDVGLSDREAAWPSQLSGGEQRRVAIARALMNEPDLLLADEPTGDLDEETEREVLDLLRLFNRSGTTLVMVTHEPRIAQLAGHVLTMSSGTLLSKADANLTGAMV
jgi:ABC-type lipoprotein export system ATPase subunit